MFLWNEEKRLANVAKHGFDFINVDQVLCHPHVLLASRYEGAETRFLAVGKIEGRMATVIYTMREDQYRIISIRSSRNEEKRAFEKLHG